MLKYKCCCVFNQIILLAYVNILNLIRLAIMHKYKYIKIQKTVKSVILLNIFLKLNLIYGWSQKMKIIM